VRAAERRDQRRCVGDIAANPGEHHGDAGYDPEESEADFARAECGSGEDYVTLRNDRFVIPVRAEQRRSLPGVIHGASATGQTVFMEPFETVEGNNELVQLAEDEAAEIVRILRELTEKLQMIRGPLLAATGRLRNSTVCLRARDSRGNLTPRCGILRNK